jgi:acyl-CoA oxidase
MATDTAPPDETEASEYVQPKVDVAALTRLLDGRHAEVRNLVRTNLAEYSSVLEEAETMSTDEFRDRVRDLVVEMASTGQTGMGFPEQYGGGGDVGASIAAFETLAFGDLSVLVKVGVQFGLFGGAILQLGTKAHHDAYLSDLITGKVMGCFAMTETGHGSNVQALGTVATYDATTEEFVITTPDDSSRWCSPSSRSTGSPRGCTPSSYLFARTARSSPASGSRTAAASSD